MLDAELNKVVTFYAEREKEMHERSKMLKKQLNELAIHRQKFYVSFLAYRWMHFALNSNPLGIIHALEEAKLVQKSISFCPAYTFATDQVVSKLQPET